MARCCCAASHHRASIGAPRQIARNATVQRRGIRIQRATAASSTNQSSAPGRHRQARGTSSRPCAQSPEPVSTFCTTSSQRAGLHHESSGGPQAGTWSGGRCCSQTWRPAMPTPMRGGDEREHAVGAPPPSAARRMQRRRAGTPRRAPRRRCAGRCTAGTGSRCQCVLREQRVSRAAPRRRRSRAGTAGGTTSGTDSCIHAPKRGCSLPSRSAEVRRVHAACTKRKTPARGRGFGMSLAGAPITRRRGLPGGRPARRTPSARCRRRGNRT